MRESILELFYQHKGKIIGSILGFFIALLIIVFGFFKTLFIIACVVVGFYLGSRYDLDQNFIEFLERFIPGDR